MSDHILKTIEQAKEQLHKQEDAVITTKKLINQLCSFAGIPPEYQDADLQSSVMQAAVVRRNAFFGKPLATCVREFLEMRRDKPVKEASLNEIVDALKEGGFDLEKISKDKDDARRGVAITLGKNPQFVRLPNDDWGLLAWYPNFKRGKPEGNGKSGDKPEDAKDAAEATPVGAAAPNPPEGQA
jgi:hypothetical protein